MMVWIEFIKEMLIDFYVVHEVRGILLKGIFYLPPLLENHFPVVAEGLKIDKLTLLEKALEVIYIVKKDKGRFRLALSLY